MLYDRIAQRHSIALTDVPKKYTKRQLERLTIMLDEEAKYEKEEMDKHEKEIERQKRRTRR